MSEQPTEGQDGPGALPLQVLAQYVKDFSFENPNAPQSLMANQPQPQVTINVDVQARLAAEGIYEVLLELRCEAKHADKVAFLAELSYAGLFQLPGVPEEHHAPLLLIEGARLLFPFARAIVADATRDGGYPPLMINPVDFVDLFRRRAAAAQAAAGSNGQQQPPF